MTGLRRGLGAGLAAIAMLALAWLSQVPMSSSGTSDAVVRLSWSARPERIEACRPATAEELAGQPQHMRQPLICEGTTASYRLEVRRDGTLLVDDVIRGGGLRHDRPLHVLRELVVPSGEALIVVRFERVEDSPTPATPDVVPAGAPESSSIELARRLREEEAVPARLSLERRFPLSPRTVTLITYDLSGRELIAIEAASAEVTGG